MDDKIIKYLNDITLAINEIGIALSQRHKEFKTFTNDFVFRKFVERNIEIIGEAMNRILRIDPNISIRSARKIVDTRNYVIHSYDSLIPEILWSIVINHLPVLKEDVEKLLIEYGDDV